MIAVILLGVMLLVALGLGVYLARKLDAMITSLSDHKSAMDAMAEGLDAQRKQIKGVLHTANHAALETKRNADRQYRQQKKVDLILYEDQIRRERLQAAREAGELNG